MKNFKVTAAEDGKEYWISRAHAVVGIVYSMDPRRNEIAFLVTRRGPGCPDNIGKWGFTCGYVDWGETKLQAMQRELWEELGLQVKPEQIQKYCEIDDPTRDQRQNIITRYVIRIEWDQLMYLLNNGIINTDSYSRGGEPGEIDAIDVIHKNEVYKKEWAFNHGRVLDEAFYFIRKGREKLPWYSEDGYWHKRKVTAGKEDGGLEKLVRKMVIELGNYDNPEDVEKMVRRYMRVLKYYELVRVR